MSRRRHKHQVETAPKYQEVILPHPLDWSGAAHHKQIWSNFIPCNTRIHDFNMDYKHQPWNPIRPRSGCVRGKIGTDMDSGDRIRWYTNLKYHVTPYQFAFKYFKSRIGLYLSGDYVWKKTYPRGTYTLEAHSQILLFYPTKKDYNPLYKGSPCAWCCGTWCEWGTLTKYKCILNTI